jgi:hypothetical protein
VFSVAQPVRINYDVSGNVEPAPHGHVIPRDAAEPEHFRAAHPRT